MDGSYIFCISIINNGLCGFFKGTGWIRYFLYIFNKQMAQMVLDKVPNTSRWYFVLYIYNKNMAKMVLGKETNTSLWYFCTKICLSPRNGVMMAAPRAPAHHHFRHNFLNYQKPLIIYAFSFFFFYGHYRCVLRVFAWAGQSRTIQHIFLKIK